MGVEVSRGGVEERRVGSTVMFERLFVAWLENDEVGTVEGSLRKSKTASRTTRDSAREEMDGGIG